MQEHPIWTPNVIAPGRVLFSLKSNDILLISSWECMLLHSLEAPHPDAYYPLIMWILSAHYVDTLRSLCGFSPLIMWIPSAHYENTLRLLCGYPPLIMWILSTYYVDTLRSLYGYSPLIMWIPSAHYENTLHLLCGYSPVIMWILSAYLELCLFGMQEYWTIGLDKSG